MVKKERWGKKFVDKRNWEKNDRQLVKRGEYLLDLDFVEGWNQELVEMNRNKVGALFKFPNSLIQLQAVWHGKSIPYRMIEGMTVRLVEMSELPDYNDYTTIDRRVNRMSTKISVPQGNNLTI